MIKICLFIIIFSYFGLFFAQGQISPLNGKQIQVDSSVSYSFIVSGHFYGSSSNKTGYPTNTILGNINNFNNSDAAFLVSLGDLFLDIRNDIPFYQKTIFQDLKIPLFNSVGNHDISGNMYQENYGETTNYFVINDDIHIILDTERDNGDIKADQLKLIDQAIELSSQRSIQNVFIYGHRTIWKNSYTDMNQLFNDNTQSLIGNNFKKDVLPKLEKLGALSKVYWFAGSIGAAPSSFFNYLDQEHNIQYIATAIRGLPRDAVLHVHSDKGKINFEPESLTGQELLSFNEYNVNYWKDNTDITPPFNWRLLPLYIKNVLLHRYFWFGAITVIILGLVLRLVIKKRK